MENTSPIFAYSLSIDDIKQRANSSEIRVLLNPKTKKSFWVCGKDSGPVSSKYDESKPASFAISAVDGTAVLCNPGAGVELRQTL